MTKNSNGVKIIIGLGNPGLKYKSTWHNAGWLALDDIQAEYGLGRFKKNKKIQAEITTGQIENKKVVLVKPLTFMNHSGIAAQAVMNFYKLNPNNLIVIHDDIDMALGKIRLAKNSSAGGHNGVKSIIENIGSQDFARIKLGVKTELLEKMGAENYVLARPTKAEKNILLEQIKKATVAVTNLVAG